MMTMLIVFLGTHELCLKTLHVCEM